MTTFAADAPPRAAIAHLALALGAFAVRTTEFATMSIGSMQNSEIHYDIAAIASSVFAQQEPN